VIAVPKELTKILRELAQFKDAFARAEVRHEGRGAGIEHEAALAWTGGIVTRNEERGVSHGQPTADDALAARYRLCGGGGVSCGTLSAGKGAKLDGAGSDGTSAGGDSCC
jgi:hypothetical protein